MMELETRLNLLKNFTYGRVLPSDPISDQDLNLLLETILKTYDSLKQSTEHYESHNENDMNSLLKSNFIKVVERDPNLQRKFSDILQESAYINFNAKHRRLQPDLQVKLQEFNKFSISVTIESKLIYGTATSISAYCNNGIKRFLNGRYAWDVSKAIMIAFIRDNSTISTRLTNYLQKGNPPNSIKFAVKKMPTLVSEVKGDVSYTVHNRDFPYIHRPNESPGPIKLIHLGLK